MLFPEELFSYLYYSYTKYCSISSIMLASAPRSSVGLYVGVQGSFNVSSNIPGHFEDALLMCH